MIVGDARTQAATLSLNPKNLFGQPGEGGGLIACPFCDGEHVHLGAVEMDPGVDEVGPGRPVRGRIITLHFWCEGGDHPFVLKLGVHKGNTFVWAEARTGPRRQRPPPPPGASA